MLILFCKGFIIGFSIAAPVGPIGILCINRTLKAGFASGLISGLGAALADAMYGCIAGFGLVTISTFLLHYATPIQIVGGLFLGYLGLKTLLSNTPRRALADNAHNLWQDLLSTFFLTLTNPATILSFLAIYSGLGILSAGADYLEACYIMLGVFLGSLLWWVILCSGVQCLHRKISENGMIWLNRFSGSVLILFGLFAILSIRNT